MKKVLKKLKSKILIYIENLFLYSTIRDDEKVAQLVLINQFKDLKLRNTYFSFSDIGFRKYSQNDEDGILLYIFSLINTTNKLCVEICGGDGIQNNTANLIINHGWNGLMFDGDESNIDTARKFYSRNRATSTFPPKIVHAWITKDNINDLIKNQGIQGEVDLLSLDIDGIDYWLWKAINVIKPRVMVAEFQCICGSGDSITVPYKDDFTTKYVDGFGIYSGASLAAFEKLSKSKGYRLIGVEKLGFNAFFLRNDIGVDIFPEVSVEECLNVPFAKWANEKYWPLVKDMDWEKV